MRKKKLIPALISLLTVILMMFTVSLTVFATEEYVPEVEAEIGEVTQSYETEYEPVTEYIPEETQAIIETEPQDMGGVVEEETQAPDNPVYELPEIESQEVVVPTTVKLPDIEVSDTSLMGGVIAWLCVALGIAVIAGVLVSQRTRQVNSGSNNPNNRR